MIPAMIGVNQRTIEEGWNGMVGAWVGRCHTVHYFMLTGVGSSGQGKHPVNTLRPKE